MLPQVQNIVLLKQGCGPREKKSEVQTIILLPLAM
jgi:hypothetical protein